MTTRSLILALATASAAFVAATAATASAPAASVEGQKLDSGLGDLPHYAKWLDKSGRDPMGRQGTQMASSEAGRN